MQEPYREILSPRFEVLTELARSVRKKRGLSISWYGTRNAVNINFIKGSNENIPEVHREFADRIFRNIIFHKTGSRSFSQDFC